MAVVVAAFFLLGIIQLHRAPRIYTVEMQVVAVSNDEMSTPSGPGMNSTFLSQFGGRSNGTQNNFELYLAGLQSIETARVLAKNPAFMHRMFADEWSERDQKWVQPGSLLSTISRTVKGGVGIYVPPWQPPDAARVNDFLQGAVTVSRSLISPVVTISVQAGDRQFGADLIDALHNTVDGILRRRTLARVSGYVDYLNRLIQNATIVEYRAALADTIMQQEKSRMVAASSSPYAADIFSRPTPSRVPTSPKGLSVLATYTILGIVIAVIGAILHDRFPVYWQFLAWPRRRRTGD